MNMGLVNVKENRLVLADLFEEWSKLLNERGSFLWIGLAQYFAALLPTQPVRLE